MQTRQLGFTDLHLTTVGLGTWAIGGPWQWGWGPQDDADSIAAIQQALDLGINWIDTAPAYGLGHSEEVIGQAVQGRKDGLIIATKCSRVWDDPSSGQIHGNLQAWSIRQEVEESLRRLDVDVIDLYQIHWPQPDEDIEQAWEEIARLVEVGKIRYAGASNFSVDQLKRVQSIHPVASLQPPFSMIHRDIEHELLPYCAEQNIGVIAYSPLQTGLLTGAFSQERLASLPADDMRHQQANFQEPTFTAILDLVDQLRPIAEGNGRTLAELAIAWVLSRPGVTAAIVGARRPEQIVQTAPAADWQLMPAELLQIEELLRVHL
ncbi:MAG: aldo/keto reductase [Chloroflexi bacterium]|nr:aldo/keto reductase [Chloroflexota bacterium]